MIPLSPEGRVLLQLDGVPAPAASRDALISATLATDGYVETFRRSDLVPDARRALIYSQRVASDGRTLGVLCLCFRLEDESLPKTQAWCAGYLMFVGESMVVADMARLLGTVNIEAPQMVIVIRAPGQTRPFGLPVEALGDIPEVARDRLLTIDTLRNEDTSMLVEFALEVTDPRDPMVMVLNTQRVANLLRGELLEAVAA